MKLKKTTLDWSLKHHERFGDTDIFPMPSEYLAIRQQWPTLLPELLDTDIESWPTSAYRRTLTPKSRFGFRTATQLSTFDSIIYSGIVYEIAKDLQAYRSDPPTPSFSHRVQRLEDGQLYDPSWNFDNFKATLLGNCTKHPDKWVVITDIADFYSRIYHHTLENSLRAATTKATHVDALVHLLKQWNYSVSSGLPVGSSASRILAEIALVDVDRVLIDHDIEFLRFSDDYRLLAESERQAHSHLATLAQALSECHLTLSERKTDIVHARQFVEKRLTGARPGDAATLGGRVAEILERYGYENDVYSSAELGDLPAGMVAELAAIRHVSPVATV